jgi:hypothetical protein
MEFEPSCCLYYGPTAEATATEAATRWGVRLEFDAGALKKDDVRALGARLREIPLSSRRHALVVGPLDALTPQSSDVLLKVLEEPPRGAARPFLWSWDLGAVAPTIRSRCLTFWAPGEDTRLEGWRPSARALVEAWGRRDWCSVVEEFREVRGEESFLLGAVVDELARRLRDDPRAPGGALWETIRPLGDGSPLPAARCVSAFYAAFEEIPRE